MKSFIELLEKAMERTDTTLRLCLLLLAAAVALLITHLR